MANESDKRPERDERQAGQIKHDERGNAVWQWAADTARTAIQSTSQLLRKLDVSSLSLESDVPEDEQEPTGSSEPTATAGPNQPLDKSLGKPSVADKRGFDPYSSNAAIARRTLKPAAATPSKAGPSAMAPSAATRSAGSKPRRSWWQRLLRRD